MGKSQPPTDGLKWESSRIHERGHDQRKQSFSDKLPLVAEELCEDRQKVCTKMNDKATQMAKDPSGSLSIQNSFFLFISRSHNLEID